MQVHQINFQYVPEDDRIVLRLNDTDNHEKCYTLTRRYVKGMISAFDSYFQAQQQRVSSKDLTPQAKQAMLEFERDQALSESNMSAPYTATPSPADPILLFQFKLQERNNGEIVMGLFPKVGNGIELTVTQNLMHSLYYLLSQAIEKAEWGLEFRMQQTNRPQNKTIN